MTPGERIVAWLRASTAPLSGEELARRLGCSRAAVWKQIGALRRLGYRIEARRAHGYALAAAPDRLGPAELAPHLAGRWRDIRWLAETDSTQRVARELGRAGAPARARSRPTRCVESVSSSHSTRRQLPRRWGASSAGPSRSGTTRSA